ncbi:MAG: methionyl-tRNA synthetase [Candidatus Berkelbacteria bacterium Gr01-1014_85]|uniref:Methionyl-tRNA synthetase n=1 Tax=Candidatus Berkelbacteria bacterium Gr01-1014_85 TaxID=2017150 RepID=A0A554JCV9_9BACT|nr:MAG: methionyl-tRNA synthetase [Candidatus Berkelbacteria bacterium Gr01-1014_85]
MNDTISSDAEQQLATIDDFAKLEIRIGRVLAVETIPESHKLLKFQIDFGLEVGSRHILSGIKASYPDYDQLVGQKVLAIINFPPRTMLAEVSNGMLLSARQPSSGQLILINPDVADQIELGAELG